MSSWWGAALQAGEGRARCRQLSAAVLRVVPRRASYLDPNMTCKLEQPVLWYVTVGLSTCFDMAFLKKEQQRASFVVFADLRGG